MTDLHWLIQVNLPALEIDFLWPHADLRGKGHGAQILFRFENEARARGCSVAFLNTYSFQAPAFYQKMVTRP